jgi:hypothetical protein
MNRTIEEATIKQYHNDIHDQLRSHIGDCLAPGIIAAAVYSGHQYARTYGEPADRDRAPFRREDIARLY